MIYDGTENIKQVKRTLINVWKTYDGKKNKTFYLLHT